MARIKGMAILGTLKFVKQTAGGERIAELLAELPAAAQETYRQRILAGSWYPYEAYASLLAVVTQRLGSGRPDFPASLGRFAAQQDVGAVFKIVSVILSARRALLFAGFMWSRYCDAGRFVMTRIDDEAAEGRIEGFPGICPEHERLVAGWIEGIGLAARAREAQVELVASVHHGSPASKYDMRWVNP